MDFGFLFDMIDIDDENAQSSLNEVILGLFNAVIPVYYNLEDVTNGEQHEDFKKIILPIENFITNSDSSLFDSIHRTIPQPNFCRKSVPRGEMVYTCDDCALMRTACIFCVECFNHSEHRKHNYRVFPGETAICDCGDAGLFFAFVCFFSLKYL